MPLRILPFTLGPFATNCYFVYDPSAGEGVIFDAGFEPEKMIEEIHRLGVRVKALINTHGHVDHVAGNQRVVSAFSIPLYIHSLDIPLLESAPLQGRLFGTPVSPSPPPTDILEEGDEVGIGEYLFKVIHTPGHTPGGLCFYEPQNGVCIVGDTLFQGSIGRTDLPGGDFETLITSIRTKLYTLPDHVVIYPGHMGSSTIGIEKQTNPFVRG
jgi:glyoxylase-like metal-dependent hydrolase (beta-lactamase superfamily II)